MPDGNAPLLDTARVRAALTGTRLSDVRYVAETASTNDDAAALLGEAAAAGATLVAEFQHRGRGRKPGRTWFAPPGSALTFTTILPNPVATAALWVVPFWTALAVADGVEAACGVRLSLRWPNDLDLGERKAGGILCVSRVAGERAHVACGIGLNVRRSDAFVAVEPAPAFLSDAQSGVERETILAAVLGAMDALLSTLDQPAAIARAWEERAGLPGVRYRVRFDADGSHAEGIALRLDREGGLLLRTSSGERVVHLADARVVSPA